MLVRPQRWLATGGVLLGIGAIFSAVGVVVLAKIPGSNDSFGRGVLGIMGGSFLGVGVLGLVLPGGIVLERGMRYRARLAAPRLPPSAVLPSLPPPAVSPNLPPPAAPPSLPPPTAPPSLPPPTAPPSLPPPAAPPSQSPAPVERPSLPPPAVPPNLPPPAALPSLPPPAAPLSVPPLPAASRQTARQLVISGGTLTALGVVSTIGGVVALTAFPNGPDTRPRTAGLGLTILGPSGFLVPGLIIMSFGLVGLRAASNNATLQLQPAADPAGGSLSLIGRF